MRRIVGGLVLVGLVAACGRAEAGFPTGVWTNTCERGTVKVLDFRSDGTLTGSFDNPADGIELDLSGRYVTNDGTITFERDTVCGDARGVYTWNLAGDDLAFTLVEDPCQGRVAALDGYVFTPVEPGDTAPEAGGA